MGEDVFAAGLAAGVPCRQDGRRPGDWRPLRVRRGVAPDGQGAPNEAHGGSAAGSARVDLGGTAVIAAASLSIEAPSDEAPACGVVRVSVDAAFAAAAAAAEDRGGAHSRARQGDAGPEAAADEIARRVQALYAPRAGIAPDGALAGCLDACEGAPDSPMCLVPGEAVWALDVDCVVLSDDGNVLGAVSIAVRAALADVRLPSLLTAPSTGEGGGGLDAVAVDRDPNAFTRLDCARCPIVVTVVHAPGSPVARPAWLMDATAAEEAAMAAAVAFAVGPGGDILGAHPPPAPLDAKGPPGGQALPVGAVGAMAEAASLAGRALHGGLAKAEAEEAQAAPCHVLD